MNKFSSVRVAVSIMLSSTAAIPSIIPSTCFAQVPGIAGTMTIAAFVEGLKQTVGKLEEAANSAINAGNTALGQQQMLLAGILKQTINQISDAYDGRMNTTFDRIDKSQYNLFINLMQVADQAKDLEKDTFRNAQATIYQTQVASNQIISVLPLTSHVPVYYGVQAKDMLGENGANAYDLEILGFGFTDKYIKNQPPTIRVADRIIPNEYISVREDRILIRLPEDLKRILKFNRDPCVPRGPFKVQIAAYYTVTKYFIFHDKRTSQFNDLVMAGRPRYTINVSYGGTRTTVKNVTNSFSKASSEINWDCENTQTVGVSLQLPDKAFEVDCNSTWDQHNAKSYSTTGCAVGGGTITSSGTATGQDRNWVHECPGGGNGHITISGTYKVPVTETEDIQNIQAVDHLVMADSIVKYVMPLDSAFAIKKLNIQICYNNCSTSLDTIALNIPSDSMNLEQGSAQGLFKAKYFGGQLTIEKTP